MLRPRLGFWKGFQLEGILLYLQFTNFFRREGDEALDCRLGTRLPENRVISTWITASDASCLMASASTNAAFAATLATGRVIIAMGVASPVRIGGE